MKKALLIIIPTIILSVAWCYAQVKNVANPSLVSGKPQCTLLIDEARGTNFAFAPSAGSKTWVVGLTKGMEVNALLINNSEDTLKYAYCRHWNNIFVKPSSVQKLIMADDPNYSFENPQLVLIPPHKYELINFILEYAPPPEKDFKFKIGLHLLKWNDNYKTTPPDTETIEHANLLWSEEELIKVDIDREWMETTDEGNLARAEIVYDTLNATDYKNYTLKAEGNKVKKTKNVYRNEDYCRDSLAAYIDIPVRLSNLTNDTLQYCNEVKTGTWTTIYTTDNQKIYVPMICSASREFPTIEEIPPRHDTLFYIPVGFNPLIVKRGTKFRIGMGLLKFRTSSQLGEVWEYSGVLAGLPKYTIWSDEIVLPEVK